MISVINLLIFEITPFHVLSFHYQECQSFEKAHYEIILLETARYPTGRHIPVSQTWNEPGDLHYKASHLGGEKSQMAGNGSG